MVPLSGPSPDETLQIHTKVKRCRRRVLAVTAVATALSPTRRAALKAKKEVPVFDSNVYKKKYYANFAEAKWRQRGARHGDDARGDRPRASGAAAARRPLRDGPERRRFHRAGATYL